ncbi:sodium-coupled monocarboxylate transporter 2 [Rhipicephalus sanguineus]|uniref:sodium-coupled monocarboxylate transporter 2 n=1 Tax=Rhipicephalus sanguineus TaxID=34632 RepID=UPI0018950BCD|nr:sodium-coupled monocarboxylate transporter 2 [Rhipicephalus sanguineus]
MPAHTFVALDYVVLISLLVLSAGIGVLFAWRNRRKNNRQFLTANRELSWVPVSLSMMASFVSSASVLGMPSEVFVRGSLMWTGAIGSTLAILMAAFIFMPMFYKMDVTSINEYLEKRFSSRAVRKMGSIIFIAHTIFLLGIALYGPSLALGSVTGIPVWSSILVNGAVCTFYTSIGGIKAVVWTDVVQVILIFTAYIMVIACGLHHLGGFGVMWQNARNGGRVIFTNFDTSPYETYTTWTMVLGFTVTLMGMYCANQIQAQRYTSIGSLKGARKALMLNVPGMALNMIMTVLSGLTLYAVYGRCDPRLTGDIRKADQLMPYIIQDLLYQYPGLSGLMAAAVYSSSLSTLSSGYNSLAAVTWEDFLRPCMETSESTALKITKVTAATYGILSMLIAFLVGTMESIMQAGLTMGGALCGPRVAIFTLGLLFPCCKKKGVIAGTVVAVMVTAWISVGSILYPRKRYTLPTTTEGCLHFNETITSGSFEPPRRPSGINQLYHISFMWFAFIGFIVHMIVALAVSLVFERSGSDDVDPAYVYPLVRKYMGRSLTRRNDSQFQLNETLSVSTSPPKELKELISEHEQRT